MSEFLADNWLVIALAVLAAWSEVMALHPKWQSSGILQFLTILADKLLKGRKP